MRDQLSDAEKGALERSRRRAINREKYKAREDFHLQQVGDAEIMGESQNCLTLLAQLLTESAF